MIINKHKHKTKQVLIQKSLAGVSRDPDDLWSSVSRWNWIFVLSSLWQKHVSHICSAGKSSLTETRWFLLSAFLTTFPFIISHLLFGIYLFLNLHPSCPSTPWPPNGCKPVSSPHSCGVSALHINGMRLWLRSGAVNGPDTRRAIKKTVQLPHIRGAAGCNEARVHQSRNPELTEASSSSEMCPLPFVSWCLVDVWREAPCFTVREEERPSAGFSFVLMDEVRLVFYSFN